MKKKEFISDQLFLVSKRICNGAITQDDLELLKFIVKQYEDISDEEKKNRDNRLPIALDTQM